LKNASDAQGDVLIPLNRSGIETLADELAEAGYESIAVGLLHSYVNDAHEKMVRDVLGRKAARCAGLAVQRSVAANARIRALQHHDCQCLHQAADEILPVAADRPPQASEGADCPIFLMHSGGGIISIESAAEFPVRLVESGPAGGAVFAANIAARYGLDKVLSFDMGGTTAKICLIRNQTPKTARVFEVARTYRFKKGSGMPISIPVIDMVEIGAGGGSLASVDAMRQIRVGPQSAGSEPGPACYGRGGERPAVTDADLMLGKLDPDNFAGGSIRLHPDASAAALKAHVGAMLDLDTAQAAFGVAEVVDENMANAARVHAVENGEDLAEYTMIAFGGAAPLHAGRLCEKLGIRRCLVPQGAGVGSAIGFLRAPFSFEANRSVFMRLSNFDPVAIKALLGELEDEATRFVRSCDANAPIQSEFKVYMRYAGQGWEIPVALTREQAQDPDRATFERLFEEDYTRLFGRPVAGMETEITVWSVNATTPPQIPDPVNVRKLETSAQGCGSRELFDPALAVTAPASIVDRSSLQPGHGIEGPAAITEDETTIIVPSSRIAIAQEDGCIDLIQKAS
jgi:N-methylhydantoinase A